jgi:branched-chain amino acid transport system substrate-binding protein
MRTRSSARSVRARRPRSSAPIARHARPRFVPTTGDPAQHPEVEQRAGVVLLHQEGLAVLGFGGIDFAADVVKAKSANADAIFVYTNEEESARFLREARKQGIKQPLIGETTLLGQKVIELAGDAANGAKGHVGLTVDAPQPAIKAFDDKFTKEYKYKSDHNGMKGYSAMYVVKTLTEKNGKVDSKLLARSLHGARISAKENPGVLLDVTFDDNGDLDRESFLVKVVNGKQVVTDTLPPASAK